MENIPRADIDAFKPYYLHNIGSIRNHIFEEATELHAGAFEEVSLILKKIELIMKYGILSYKMQKEIIGETFRRCRKPHWNDDDYISLSDTSAYVYDPKQTEFGNDDSRFFQNPYLDISFIVLKDISTELEFRDKILNNFSSMDTEVQVKDKIDNKYILGLRVPSIYPYRNFKEKAIDDRKHYKEVIRKNTLFLQEHFPNLHLYASFTGKEISRQLSK